MVTVARRFIDNSELRGILDDGKPEQTIIWREHAGTWCRCLVDFLKNSRSLAMDYKTTTTANPEAFIRTMGNLGYDTQASFYQRGIRAYTQSSVRFVFLAQEITPPYACSLIALSSAYQQIADAKVSAGIATWGDCLAENKWPSYPTRICYAEPKTWQLREYELNQLEAA